MFAWRSLSFERIRGGEGEKNKDVSKTLSYVQKINGVYEKLNSIFIPILNLSVH